MGQFTAEQRTFMVLYYNRTQSLVAVQNAFRQRLPGRNPPSKNIILQNFRKYSEHGTSLNRNKNNSGRPRTARSQQNIAAVRRLLEHNPRDVSARRNPVQVSSTAFNCITRLDLGWHPYRMHVGHELLPNDYLRGLRFSQWFNQKCEEDPHFLDHVVIGDEASFVMDGEVNSHNVRRYAPKGHPPEFNFNRSDSRAKLTVWAGLCGNGVILGPYFFEGNVNGVAYLQMLHEYVLPLLAVHFRDHFENGLFRDLCQVI